MDNKQPCKTLISHATLPSPVVSTHYTQFIPHVLMVSCLVMGFNMACNLSNFLMSWSHSAQYKTYITGHTCTLARVHEDVWVRKIVWFWCSSADHPPVGHRSFTSHVYFLSHDLFMTHSDRYRLLSSLDSDLYKSCAVNKLCVIIPRHLQIM